MLRIQFETLIIYRVKNYTFNFIFKPNYSHKAKGTELKMVDAQANIPHFYIK